MSPKPVAKTREAFCHFANLQTRWNDNDTYGHINNAVYYEFFDKVVNDYLIAHKLITIHAETSAPIGLVVETRCHFFAPISYPETITAGLCVTYIGNSSVCYEIGLFQETSKTAAAQGKFVHVYVDAQNTKPQKLSDDFKTVMATLMMS